MPNGWRMIKSLIHKIRFHGRRGKGMAESFSREKLRQAPERWMENPVLPSSCVTPACTPIEVQNEWEENTHTKSRSWSAEQGKKKKKSLAAPPPPPYSRPLLVRRKKKKKSRRIHMFRRYACRRYAGGLGPSRIRTMIPTTRRL